MKVTLQSTEKIVKLVNNGQEMPARIWEGVTENGIRCHAYITRIAVHKDDDASEFDRELQEHQPPSIEINAIPFRMIIG